MHTKEVPISWCHWNMLFPKCRRKWVSDLMFTIISNLAEGIYPVWSHTRHSGYIKSFMSVVPTLQWYHNGRDGVSNHRRLFCVPKRFFQTQMNENIESPRHWPLWGEFTAVTGVFPHKEPVTRRTFPFDDVTMETVESLVNRFNEGYISLMTRKDMTRYPLAWY